MDRNTALKILGLDASASLEQLESAHRRSAAELKERIENATNDALRSKYRAERDELERAVAAVRMHGTDHIASGSQQPQGLEQSTPPVHGEAEAGRQAPGDPLHLPEGRLLADRFEVRSRIGIGGLGAVYAAFDRDRGEEIALRVFLPGVLKDDRARERFLREVQFARDLNHPGIVRVLDVERDAELDFIVMELLEGVTLRQEMAALSASGQRFSVDEAVHIGHALCDALGYAHQHTCHGGVKPESVFLCDDGTVRLSDFGVNRLSQMSQSSIVGVSVRAVSYMSPEQLKGSKDIDQRADQYSTAAVLYEMLTGEAPVGRVKSARERGSDIPRALSQALDRALAPDPADRFPDMGAFGEALAGHSASRVRRAWPWVAALVILLLVAANAAFPRWQSSVSSMIRSVLHDSEAQAVAETARTQALASASAWEKLAELLPEEQMPDGTARADEAFSAGDSHLEATDYGKAEESFRQALELYESQTATAALLLRDEPARVARIARDFLDKLGALERELYARASEAVMRVEGCEASLRNARTEEERTEIESRRRAADDELTLINRLKMLTNARVFIRPLRSEIASKLTHADQQVEEGSSREALSTYAECKARLEELLAWPGQAESALREHATLSEEMERLRSTLGAVALGLNGVRSAFDDAAGQMTLGDEELAEGRVPEALVLFESARNRLSKVQALAAEGLLSKAQTCDNEGKLAAAVRALDELLALDPDHTAGERLRSKIVSYRMTNSVSMEFVFIPPGEFTMGSPQDEAGRDEDEGQGLVKVASGFWMGTTEVTQAQWSTVMGGNPSNWKGDDLPVEQIAWEEALEFCRRLSDRETRRYRLPTEEEWEYACRAGTTTPFYSGKTISTDQANYDGDYAYGSGVKGVFRNETVPVGNFPPNAWGLHDMHGNVWEWCPDSRKDYPPSLVKRSAEEAPIEGRVLRGGSWRSRPRYCRSANRVRDTEGSRLSNIGLRVVLESE